MPPYMTGSTDRFSGRFRRLVSDELTPRNELAAGFAVVALLVQLLVAQVTLLLVIVFLGTSRVSRWRPLWLAVPFAVGCGWLLAVGVRSAVDGYLAGAGQLLGHLASGGTLPSRLRPLPGVLAGWRAWLPRQFPLALVAGSVEAALIGLPGRAGRNWPYRPGGLVAARNRYLTAALRRGELATRQGCCLGVITAAGSRAEITWRDAEGGVLCTGEDAASVSAVGRDIVLAAIAHRKTVIVIELASGGAGGCWLGAACADVAAPLMCLSDAIQPPAAERMAASFFSAFAERGVVHVELVRRATREAANGEAAAGGAAASAALDELMAQLAEHRDLGIGSDGLVWIDGCEATDLSHLSALVDLGPKTGTAVVLGTASAGPAAALAAQVNVIAVRGSGPAGVAWLSPPDGGDADRLAALRGPGRPAALSLHIGRRPHGHVVDCELVR
jgi:hypothetical protein